MHDSIELFALAAAGPCRAPQMFTNNKGLKAANQHREEMVALGYGTYTLAVEKLQKEVGLLLERRAGRPCAAGSAE